MMRAFFIAFCVASLRAWTAFALPPDAITDSMTDDEIRKYRDEHIAELERRARDVRPRKGAEGATYPRIFFCTLYYTPKESGFTAERGFDATPESAPGLGGRAYPRSFLQAVKKEGFGRLVAPVNGRNYIRYNDHGAYGFAKAPTAANGRVLVPRRSCAVSTKNKYLSRGAKLAIDSETVQLVTGSKDWEVCDTGGGVRPLQIDLYWGEDEPKRPVGRQRARPRSTWMEYAFEVVVTVKE
jgi:hypothetical protein